MPLPQQCFLSNTNIAIPTLSQAFLFLKCVNNYQIYIVVVFMVLHQDLTIQNRKHDSNMYSHVNYRLSPSFLHYKEIETYILKATRRKLLIIDTLVRKYVICNTWRRYCSNYVAHCTTNICCSLWIQKHCSTPPAHQLTLHSCTAIEHSTLLKVEGKEDFNQCFDFFFWKYIDATI